MIRLFDPQLQETLLGAFFHGRNQSGIEATVEETIEAGENETMLSTVTGKTILPGSLVGDESQRSDHRAQFVFHGQLSLARTTVTLPVRVSSSGAVDAVDGFLVGVLALDTFDELDELETHLVVLGFRHDGLSRLG